MHPPLANSSHKKHVALAAALLTGVTGAFSPLLAAPPELKTLGNQVVVKSTGTPIRLVGVNIPSLDWSNGENLAESVSKAIASWHSNVLRLPVDQANWNASEAYRVIVDGVITQASDAGVYVILDLHEYEYPKAASITFWNNAANRYKNNPAVLFGLLNEPHGTTWDVGKMEMLLIPACRLWSTPFAPLVRSILSSLEAWTTPMT